MITVYTKPDCQPCKATKRELDIAGLAYIDRDVSQDPTAAAELAARGLRAVPVVVTDTDMWSGHRPDRIRGIR